MPHSPSAMMGSCLCSLTRTGTMSRRHVLAGIILLAGFAPEVASAQATDWPTRAVTVVVPFAAGGNTDIMARIASQKLAEVFQQGFVVENRVGAGGAIAATYVAQAAPDGYTLFFAAAPQIAVLPNVRKVNYDPHKDFTPVSIFGTGPFILAISSAIPAKTISEFVEYAKNRKLNYGSGGTGSVSHLSGALFVARSGLDAVHIPFRGGAPAMTALPRPPFLEPDDRCSNRMGTGQVLAFSASTSGVSSSLSSTKTSSAPSGATAGPSRASSSSMLCFSLRVGTITVRLGVSPLLARLRSASTVGRSNSIDIETVPFAEAVPIAGTALP